MIYRYPQFLSAKEYARKHSLKIKTMYDRMKRRKIGYEKVSGIYLMLDTDEVNRLKLSGETSPAPTNKLVLARKFAIANKYSPDKIYEAIILGKLNAFIAGGSVFIYPEDPSTVEFIENNRPKKTKYSSRR